MKRLLILTSFLTLAACEKHGTCEADTGGASICTLTSQAGCERLSGEFTEVSDADPAKDGDAAYEAVDGECNTLGYQFDCDGNWVASEAECASAVTTSTTTGSSTGTPTGE